MTNQSSEEMVTIPKSQYDRLVDAAEWLDCLNAAGVDNWEGIDEAIRIRNDEEPT